MVAEPALVHAVREPDVKRMIVVVRLAVVAVRVVAVAAAQIRGVQPAPAFPSVAVRPPAKTGWAARSSPSRT